MSETVQVEWLDGPNKGKFEWLTSGFMGYVRKNNDGTTTLLVGKQPFRIVGPYGLTPLMAI